MKNGIDLTQGAVARHVWRMTPPMAVAFLALMAFNLADTWFVSKLGTEYLAAMGFTFPVIMLVHFLVMGLGLGVSSCVSHAIGANDSEKVKHLATYGLLLTVAVCSMLAVAGYFLLPYILNMLGASGRPAELAAQYLSVWLFFIPLGEIPVVGNNAIRATGDTLRPSIVMVTVAVLNVLLDPLFIFGLGPIPALGMRGAALATGIARIVAMLAAVWLMYHRCNLLTLRWTGFRDMLRNWGSILHIALPCAATNLLMPLSMGLITRFISGFGATAVAATAAGQRIEQFTYLVPMAMGSTLVPIIGQNWGAKRVDRVREVWVKTSSYGVIYGVSCFLLSFPLAAPAARCFSSDPEVVELMSLYIQIMLGSSALQHLFIYTGFAFNAIKKPLHASLLTIIRFVVLAVPLSWLISRWLGVQGVYLGMAAATVISGILSLLLFRHTIRIKPKV